MDAFIQSIIFAIAGYLIGSISTAIIVCKILNLPDPRLIGSGNPGATNVLRSGSKTAALITLIGDMAKGLIPTLLALYYTSLTDSPNWLPALTGIAAFLGHLFPIFLGFKGGKGVATAFGVLLGIAWPIFLLTVITWLIVALLFRYSALAALTAFALAPLYAFWLLNSKLISGLLIAMTIFIFWRHASNIQRLANKQESKIKLTS